MVGVQPLVVAVCQFEPVVGRLHDAISTGFNPHPFNSTLTCFRSFSASSAQISQPFHARVVNSALAC